MTSPEPPEPADTWFEDHYRAVPRQIIEYLAADGLSLEGKCVADIGCGDGIIDLGLMHEATPKELIGFDIAPTDVDHLLAVAHTAGIPGVLPPGLSFATSTPDTLPAPDSSFDFVISWSAFEHVADPGIVCREIARILRRDTGVLFLQLWPFYFSQHGSHLWDWFPEGWVHLQEDSQVLEQRVRASAEHALLADARLEGFRTLNRLTVDGLQDALESAGLRIAKLQLLGCHTHLPTDLVGHRVLDLVIEGVQLLAIHGR